MLTGRLVEPDENARRDLAGFLKGLAGRIGEPVIRKAVATAIGVMGDQFVLGRTIRAALKRAARSGFICSFDMLGEGARTEADAERYEAAYLDAIAAVGEAAGGQGPEEGHGISVKLSALHPRYEATQEARVMEQLYPRLLRIVMSACEQDINLTLDAEEADRLVLSLKLLEKLTAEPGLHAEWRGLGLAVQAYQKRGPQVIDQVAELARRSGRRLMVRLVKGAYWDAEIKRAQVAAGRTIPSTPPRPATDLSYLVAAERLLAAAPALYGQFATHNAHTLAPCIGWPSGAGCVASASGCTGWAKLCTPRPRRAGPTCRCASTRRSAGTRTCCPIWFGGCWKTGPTPRSCTPCWTTTCRPRWSLAIRWRRCARSLDPTRRSPSRETSSCPSGAAPPGSTSASPASERGWSRRFRRWTLRAWGVAPADATAADIEAAFAAAHRAQPAWDAIGGAARARTLNVVADAIEAEMAALAALLCREAGKTYPDAVAEVREAADFCRYYGAIAARDFAGPRPLPGPVGEFNAIELHGRGVFIAISPWNFPLSIFTGQVAAALAAGNAVLAKPPSRPRASPPKRCGCSTPPASSHAC